MEKHELDNIASSTAYVLKKVHDDVYKTKDYSMFLSGGNVGMLASAFVLEKELGALNKNIESIAKVFERQETSSIELGQILDSVERLRCDISEIELKLQLPAEATNAPGEEE